MRNFIFGMLALGIMALAFACQKESTTESATDLMNAIANSTDKQAVSVSDLPDEVQDYVAMSFTPVDIESAWRVRRLGYEVELEDGQNLYFREDGRCIGAGARGGIFRCMRGDTVDASSLPPAAVDYAATNYPDAAIQTVVTKPNGGFAVELSEGTILLFNAEGGFFRLCGQFDGGGHGGLGDGPHGPRGGCTAGDTISAGDLPTAAAGYLAAHYAAETVALVVVKPSGKFGVELSNGVVLLFAPDGSFVKECDGTPPGGPGNHHCNAPITFDDLPQAAQDYLGATYPGETVERGCVKNNGNYIVRLSNDEKILFDADGNVLFDSGN